MPKYLSTLLFIFAISIFFPIKASAFRFISWADSRGSSGVNTTTLTGLANQINALSVKPVLTIFGGDLENSGFTGATSGAWTTSLGTLFSKTFPVRGNHDSSNESGWVGYFNTRANVTTVGGSNYNASKEDLIYSFDYENSRFILLDTPGDITSNLSGQLSWLEGRLSDAQNNSNIVHVFIMAHGPIWAMGGHIITPPSSLLTILEKYPKVSATFHGHEHIMAYAHISPANFSTYGLKTNYFEEFLTGNAGAPAYSCDSSRTIASGYYCGSYSGFATVDVNGADVTVNYYKLGTTTPTFTKNYSNAKTGVPTPTPVVSPTPKPSSTPTPTPSVTGCPTLAAPVISGPATTISAGSQNIVWNAISGAVKYAIRIDDMSTPWTTTTGCLNLTAGDVCVDTVASNSYSFNFQAGRQYNIWVHATNSCNVMSAASTNYKVTVSAAVTPTPTRVPTPTPSSNPSINPLYDVNKDGVINLLDVLAVLAEIFR